MFETENEMSVLFEKFFRSTFGNAYIKECKGLSAIPDFVCYVKEPDNVAIISFELKLINWRKAATRTKPYSTHMAEKMRTVVEPYRKKTKNIDLLIG